MQIVLENDSVIDIELSNSPVTDLVLRWFHHLRHVKIPFRPWEYAGYVDQRSTQDLVDDLLLYSKMVSVEIDTNQILDQDYLNVLHKVYENNYDGRQSWTDYHEHIHILENRLRGGDLKHILEMNYRHLSGPLNQPFQMDWLAHGRTKLHAGDVYLAWDELGKTPYTYWRDREPNDLQRLRQLAKPWLTIRPKIHVCLRDLDLDPGKNNRFENWWKGFEKDWCQHYNISSWSNRDANTVLVIGKIQNYRDLEHLLDQKIWPQRIVL